MSKTYGNFKCHDIFLFFLILSTEASVSIQDWKVYVGAQDSIMSMDACATARAHTSGATMRCRDVSRGNYVMVVNRAGPVIICDVKIWRTYNTCIIMIQWCTDGSFKNTLIVKIHCCKWCRYTYINIDALLFATSTTASCIAITALAAAGEVVVLVAAVAQLS